MSLSHFWPMKPAELPVRPNGVALSFWRGLPPREACNR